MPSIERGPKRKIEKVFVTEDVQKNLNRENQSLNLFKNVHVFYKSRRELDNICGRDETAHQGIGNAIAEGIDFVKEAEEKIISLY